MKKNQFTVSAKSQELTTQHLLRVNPNAKTHALPLKSDKATMRVRGGDVYVPRIRAADEALPPSSDLFQREVYRTGDGEQRQVTRAGSMEAFTKPSRGFST